jgi:hypothetical protein
MSPEIGEKRRGRRGPPVGTKLAEEYPAMPPTVSVQLPNRKHELFARFVANGETYTAAYELSGYTPSTANASTMAARPEVAERIAALKEEKEQRDIRFEVECKKANVDPNTAVANSREVAEWNVETVLRLYHENTRLAQIAGQFGAAQASLDSIAKIMGLMESNSGSKNDKPSRTEVGIAIYSQAVEQLGAGGAVSVERADNPLAPAVSSLKDARRK